MRNCIIILFVFLIVFACKVKPELTVSEKSTFLKMLGGFLDEKAYDVQETNDGGFLVAGSINIFVDDPIAGEIEKEVAYLAKTDRFGNLQWQRQYPSQAIRVLAKAPSGGWYLGADSLVNIAGSRFLNYALFKIDDLGNVEWVRKYDNNPRQEQVKSLLVDEEKAEIYLLGDFRQTLISNDIRMFIIATDLQGNFIGSANFGTANPANNSASDGPNDVGNVIFDIYSPNKNLILCGTSLFQGPRNRDIRVTPLRFDGSLQAVGDYNNLFGSLGDDRGEQVINTRDRNVAVVGTISGGGAGGRDIYVAKVLAERFSDGGWNNLTIEWDKTFGSGGDDEGKSIFQADDGGYFVVGNLQTVGNGLDIYLIKLDFLGNVQWERQFGGTRNDQARLVKQLANGDILILGTITFENNTMIALIRTDRNGNLIK